MAIDPSMQLASPQVNYKYTIINTLNDAIQADLSSEKRKYALAVKNITRLIKRYIPRSAQKELESIYQEMNKELKELDKKTMNQTQKEGKKTEIMYFFYDTIAMYIFDVITHSIVEKDAISAIRYDGSMDGLKKVAKAVKNTGNEHLLQLVETFESDK